MTMIGIETATARLSVALRRPDGHITERYKDSGLSHCELLTGFILELIEDACLSVDDIECIAVSCGPGSFTGLRIGIASAMGLAYGIGKPVCGIDTLMGLAWNAAVHGSLVCPIIDAKRSELYTAIYRVGYDIPHILMKPTTIPVNNLVEKLSSFDEPITVTGPAAGQFCDTLGRHPDNRISCIPDHSAQATARSIVELGNMIYLHNGGTQPALLKPLYLRRSDAEIGYSSSMNRS